jgi:large subunit ribosomal protein L24
MATKIRSNDEVIVIAGKEKGKRGKVVKVCSDGRLIISGINKVKRHTKPNPMLGRPGGIVEKEAPIQVSNVAIFNPEVNKADRIGFEGTGKDKQRIFKSTGKPVES